MGTRSGVVEATSSKFGFAVKIEGEDGWFSTKKPEWVNPKPQKGDSITFDDGGAKYLNKVKILSSSGGGTSASGSPAPAPAGRKGFGAFPIDPLDGQRSIIRQNALGHAVNLISRTHELDLEDPDDLDKMTTFVIEVARRFEAYSAGDLDAAEAEEAMRELTSTS